MMADKKRKFEILKKSFLGEHRPIKFKGVPITVCKGEIFIGDDSKTGVISKIASEHNARIFYECDSDGRVVGISIVPNVGFNGETMEGWFDRNGIVILKKLAKLFS